jgi:ribokinase
VLGSVNVDFVVSVDHLPVAGETVTGGTFAQHHGGKGANQAVAAARLGANVTLVGAVGDDELGRVARANLEAEGVLIALREIAGVPTGVALIVVDRNGQNQIAVASGANATFEATEWQGFGGGDVFLAGFEVLDGAVVAGAHAASAAGALVLINPAPARELPGALLATRPILIPNELEAQALTGDTDPVSAARLLAARSGAPVVVTLGPHGAIVVRDGEIEHVPAPSVEAVDTTGAGDTFAGALAAELSAGKSLLESVRTAVEAASLSVTIPGAREGMPTRADVERRLRGET